jgi:two-component system, OmpR family, sensor histidine kinase VicK
MLIPFHKIEHAEVLKDSSERTEILDGPENVLARVLERLSLTKERVDLCGDSTGPALIIANETLKKAYVEAAFRGVKIRNICEITKDNISYCKEFMKFSELRHLDDVVGSFGIGDNMDYIGIAKLQSQDIPVQAIFSSMKLFVEQQQYFFDTLWNRAIPAVQKIKEIEEGIVPDFIETIRNPKEIQELEMRLVKMAKEEILVIYPTVNTFHRQKDKGVIELLKKQTESATGLRPKIRILTPADYRIQDTTQKLKQQILIFSISNNLRRIHLLYCL